MSQLPNTSSAGLQLSVADQISRRAITLRKSRMSTQHWLLVAMLVLAPLAAVVYKLSGLPGAAWLAESLTLDHLPHDMKSRVCHVLFTPLGAWVVVFFRLTLGLRVLGPFRSVLLAIAFQVTGIPVGLVFFGLVVAMVTFLRPKFKAMRLPFFGRTSAMLVAVSSMIVAAMLVGEWAGVAGVIHAAFFPVVVLTLSGDAFATTRRKEGLRSALWRASATAVAAVIITLFSRVGALQHLLLSNPELTLTCLAGVLVTSDLLAIRCLQWLNPPPVKKKKKGKKKPAVTSTPTPEVATTQMSDPSLVTQNV